MARITLAMRQALALAVCFLLLHSIQLSVYAQGGGDLERLVAAANADFSSKFESGDAAAIALSYTSNGELMAPRYPPTNGQREIERYWADFFKSSDAEGIFLRNTRLEWIDSASRAYEIGSFRYLSRENRTLEVGKYTVIWALDGPKPLRLTHAFSSDSPSRFVPALSQQATRSRPESLSGNRLILDIAAANTEFMRAWASGDQANFASLFEDASLFMVQDRPTFRGREPLKQYLRESNGNGVRSFLLSIQSVGVTREESIAYESGTFEKKNIQGHVLEKGSYISIWRLDQGSRPLMRSAMITTTFR